MKKLPFTLEFSLIILSGIVLIDRIITGFSINDSIRLLILVAILMVPYAALWKIVRVSIKVYMRKLAIKLHTAPPFDMSTVSSDIT